MDAFCGAKAVGPGKNFRFYPQNVVAMSLQGNYATPQRRIYGETLRAYPKKFFKIFSDVSLRGGIASEAVS